jgi:peptide-methionine (R)-S-oxide reductase
MKRRDFLGVAGLFAVLPGSFAKEIGAETMGDEKPVEPIEIVKLEKPKKEWKAILDREAYQVLFEEATERPFTSALLEEKRKGTYICAACFLPLFESDAKYESGTGWPSFFQAIESRLGTRTDFKLLLPRTEYHCARCGGHQGHVSRRAQAHGKALLQQRVASPSFLRASVPGAPIVRAAAIALLFSA